MALSGSITTGTSSGRSVTLEWTAVQNIANNQTTISWKVKGSGTAEGYVIVSELRVTIDGNQVYYRGTGNHTECYRNTVLETGATTITHNADGTRSVTMKVEAGIYQWAINRSQAGTFALDTIPRAAAITSAPNFSDNGNPTIKYSNSAGNAVMALDACISLTGDTADISYRAISKTGSSYTFDLTAAERDVLRNGTPGPSRTVTFIVRTTIGYAVYYDRAEKTLTIQETSTTKPSVSLSISPVNPSGLPSALAGSYIQGISAVRLSSTASAKYGANISGRKYTADTQTGSTTSASWTSAPINNSGSKNATVSVTDSRGFTNSATKTFTVLAYSSPVIVPHSGESNVICRRCLEDGTPSTAGTFLKIKFKLNYSSLSGQNSCVLKERHKLSSAAWTDSWQVLHDSSVDGNEGELILDLNMLAAQSYDIQLRAVDDVTPGAILLYAIPTDIVPLHLGAGGRNVGIGRYCNYDGGSDRVDVAFDAYFEGKLVCKKLPEKIDVGTETVTLEKMTSVFEQLTAGEPVMCVVKCGSEFICIGHKYIDGDYGSMLWLSYLGYLFIFRRDNNEDSMKSIAW